MSTTFQYTPLSNANRIRLLKLLPSPSRGAKLAFELEEISLSSTRQQVERRYEAISYTWDGQKPTCSVWCASSDLQITKNAAAVLCRLRRCVRPRWLWIDAICINQASIEEKNVQLSLMLLIYSRASSVVIWLGYVGSSAELASFLRFVRKYGRERGESLDPLKQLYMKVGKRVEIGAKLLTQRSYWSRVWTLQEVAYNPICQVYCEGLWPFSLDSLCSALEYLHHPHAIFGGQGRRWTSGKGGGWERRCFQAVEFHAHSRWPEWYSSDYSKSMFAALTEKKSSDPRDRVLALKGMFINVLGGVTAAYGNTVLEVYTQAAAAILESTPYLCRLLTYACQENKQISTLPSWAPDWTTVVDDDYTHLDPPLTSWRIEKYGRRLFIKAGSSSELQLPASNVFRTLIERDEDLSSTDWLKEAGTIILAWVKETSERAFPSAPECAGSASEAAHYSEEPSMMRPNPFFITCLGLLASELVSHTRIPSPYSTDSSHYAGQDSPGDAGSDDDFGDHQTNFLGGLETEYLGPTGFIQGKLMEWLQSVERRGMGACDDGSSAREGDNDFGEYMTDHISWRLRELLYNRRLLVLLEEGSLSLCACHGKRPALGDVVVQFPKTTSGCIIRAVPGKRGLYRLVGMVRFLGVVVSTAVSEEDSEPVLPEFCIV